MYLSHTLSPVGKLMLASDGRNLCGLWIEGQKYFAHGLTDATVQEKLPVFVETENWLNRYFAGEKPEIKELPLAPAGSEFRQAVWKILRKIPYGQTTTYGKIADELAHSFGLSRMSAQAVGGAVGHNPISIILPCHRVVGGDGSLTGYAGGIEKKIWLLRHEGVNTENLNRPKKGSAL